MVTRAQFLGQLTSAGWLFVLTGCGGGGDAPAPAPAAPAPSAVTPVLTCSAIQITNNHGHDLSIPAADLNSTVPKTYDILGAGGHSHQVTFSAAELAQLKAGQPVTVASTSTLAHSHDVTGACI